MRRLLYLIASQRRFTMLLCAMFLSVSLMFMGKGTQEQVVRTVTISIFNAGRFTFSWAISMLDLWRENQYLRRKNLEYATRMNANYLAAQENETLRRLLDFKEKYPYGIISAVVVGQDIDRIMNALILDVGSRDGVRKNMAVITAEGLVGRIFEVYPSSSSVQLLVDVNSKLSAMIEGDRLLKGIVRWEGGQYLRMYLVEHINDPVPGARIYTTGLGGTFPDGLFIGTIAEDQDPDVRVYASINIVPAVDVSHTHEVFILSGSERSDIWDDSGTGPFPRPEIQ